MNTHTHNKSKRQVAILGSTGSIGTQALQVIEEHSDLYEVYALTANNSVDLLIEQARRHQPDVVVIANEAHYSKLCEALADLPIKVYAGENALCEVVEAEPIDIVLASMVGYAGLRPTMNAIRAELDKIDPTIFMYGEGWAADSPQLPYEVLAMKANAHKMPRIAVFSDEMRDGIRGPWDNEREGAFLIGKPGNEMSIMYGLVGCIPHPQIINRFVNHSQKAWAAQPTQMISYVSCHDDMCLADRIKHTLPKRATLKERIALHKLAETFVLTSQGVPFIFAGDEVMRDKKGVNNSYNCSDEINTINWKQKTTYREVFDYIKDLIAMRKTHPAFRMGDADRIRKHLKFLQVDGSNLIAFILKDHANGDAWNNIVVAFNSRKKPAKVKVPKGNYTIVCKDGKINPKGMGRVNGAEVVVPAQSALIMHQTS